MTWMSDVWRLQAGVLNIGVGQASWALARMQGAKWIGAIARGEAGRPDRSA